MERRSFAAEISRGELLTADRREETASSGMTDHVATWLTTQRHDSPSAGRRCLSLTTAPNCQKGFMDKLLKIVWK